MTIKEFYENAKAQGKEDYEMIITEMGNDREYLWFKVKPRYGVGGNVVFMEIDSALKREETNIK